MGDNRGIIILGAPRSGTTLVRRILNAHPRIACPGETCMLSACARFLQTETVADGLEFGVLSGLAFAGFDEAEILSRLRAFAFSFHEEYARNSSKARWAEKTAVDIFHLHHIETLCADHVQYVFVVRHGLDVACSNQEFATRGFSYLTELHEYIRKYPRPLEAFAHAWVDAGRLMLDFAARHPENATIVRYEDIVRKPTETLPDLFSFLHEKYNDEVLDNAMQQPKQPGFGDWKSYNSSEIEQGSMERWKSLPPGVTSRLGSICNPLLREFDYAEVPVKAPDNQSAARRKYQFSLTFGSAKNRSS